MSTSARKRCVVAYATRDQQFLWTVDVPATATVAEVIAAARAQAANVDIPWEQSDVGIFGQLCAVSDVPIDGDRIELYRPLKSDPRERRRQQVRAERKAKRMR